MNSINKTLYIPLYGKAYVSGKGILLEDKKSEEIWASEGFALRGRSSSKWLAYYMGMRSAVFDTWLRQQMSTRDEAVVVQIGCGMDSRVLRVGAKKHRWYDVDFCEVIEERKRYFSETDDYKMLAGDVRDSSWLAGIPERECAIVVMEGVSMYLTHGELQELTARLCAHFEKVYVLMDCYTVFAAKMSGYKNPVKDVGVTQVYGMDDPEALNNNGFAFVKEHSMTPQSLIEQLSGMEKYIFKKLYAGKFSEKLYRLYEYRKQ
ncbi:MAG: class I SAM-dependent methyltransferase [Clostridia bacterium]|nr:class I SAM-dependent methyltransferase [Clostridia bacterium]